MNRRHFLSGGLAVIAAAGLPKAVKKKKQSQLKPVNYRSALKPNTAGQKSFNVSLYHETLYAFKAAKEENKFITLTGKYFETTDTYYPTKSSIYKFLITSVTSKDGVYEVQTKFNNKVSGDFSYPKEFPKDLRLKIIPHSSAKILGKNKEELVHLIYETPRTTSDDDYDYDCFLTTACVHHKKLADDCTELNTLRDLRDNFMANSEEGRQIICEYGEIGPRLIQNINNCENKAEIYDYMYDHLVIPSVDLINQGRKQEAVDYYEVFVKEMKSKYL